MKTNDKFRFFAPVDFLEKAKDKKGNEVYKVGGIISDSSKDADGENLDPNGFDFSEFNYINWNHGKSPSDIIGEPENWKVIPNKGVYMEGYIYADSAKGQEAVELMKVLRNSKKGNHLGWSVEGQVLERDLINPNKVKKARITAVALCPFPKNGNTFAELLRKGFSEDSFQEDEDLQYETDEEGNIINEKMSDGSEVIVDDKGNVIVRKSDDDRSAQSWFKESSQFANQNAKENLAIKSQTVENSSALIREDVEGNEKEMVKSAIVTIVKAHKEGLVTDKALEKCLNFRELLSE